MAQIHGGSYEKRLDFNTVALRGVGNNLECKCGLDGEWGYRNAAQRKMQDSQTVVKR